MIRDNSDDYVGVGITLIRKNFEYNHESTYGVHRPTLENGCRFPIVSSKDPTLRFNRIPFSDHNTESYISHEIHLCHRVSSTWHQKTTTASTNATVLHQLSKLLPTKTFEGNPVLFQAVLVV